jgi:hypothetical protein
LKPDLAGCFQVKKQHNLKNKQNNMTWEELLKASANGILPKVKRGDVIGQVTTIKARQTTKGCAVDFGKGYDDWFHAENTGDKRSKYMDELSFVASLIEKQNGNFTNTVLPAQHVKRRIAVVECCWQCPHHIHDDQTDEAKWGKSWCEKMDIEVFEPTKIIDERCPLPSIA